MLVSPTEPLVLRNLGTTSSVPEEYGVDFLLTVKDQLVGIQRKEYSDLIASVQGDRVYRELPLMKRLDIGIWLIEGRPQWTNSGTLLTGMGWTRDHETGLIISLQRRGFWISWQDSIQGTIAYLSHLPECLSKDLSHSSLNVRPTPTPQTNFFGSKLPLTKRDLQKHILQGFPAIGALTADAIIQHLGLPLKWTCTREELEKVPGLGKKKVAKIWESLDGNRDFGCLQPLRSPWGDEAGRQDVGD